LHGRVLSLVCALATLVALAGPAQAAPGDISTFAGTGAAAFAGDGGAATSAALNQPVGVAWLGDGSVLVADYRNHRVRRISPSGVISTVAGTGIAGFSGDGGTATSARLNGPTGVDATADGGFLIADLGNRRVRKVSPSGRIATVAGTGVEGSSGDGGPAASARLAAPVGVASTPGGGFLVADAGSNRVRYVSSGGTIYTAAGGGGSTADGVASTSALLAAPVGVAALPGGGFLVAEYEGHRVRRVSATGKITRVAGTGTAGFSGEGGEAAAARLDHPVGVSATADGGFLIADTLNGRVRKVSPGGAIVTVAGAGQQGYSGDGAPAAQARLNSPNAAVEGPNGSMLIADGSNNRLRLIEGEPPAAWAPPGSAPPPADAPVLRSVGRVLRAAPDGTVRVPVGCPITASERCRGTVRLELRTGGKRRAAASVARMLVLAKKRFSIAAGRERAIKLRLSRTGRRLLRKRRTLSVRAVVARRGGPNIGRSSERVTLKLKRKRRRRG
jgi:hypothetical protein